MSFFIKDFFSKCDQICSLLWIWSHLLKKSLMEDFTFCAVQKDIPKLYSLRCSLPRYHQSYGLRNWKCSCERQNKLKLRVRWYICRCCQKSVRLNICYSETYFHISLAKGVFPDKKKLARVTPIFKKGNETLVTYNRPISVLLFF